LAEVGVGVCGETVVGAGVCGVVEGCTGALVEEC